MLLFPKPTKNYAFLCHTYFVLVLPIASAKLDIIHGCAMVPSLTPMVLLVVGSTLVCVHPHTPIGLGMWVCHTIPLCSPHALAGFVGRSQGPAAGSQARRVQTEKRRENRDISPSPGRGELDPEDVCPVRVALGHVAGTVALGHVNGWRWDMLTLTPMKLSKSELPMS